MNLSLALSSFFWPKRHLVAEKAIWVLLAEGKVIILLSPALGPEFAILGDMVVQEEEFLVGPVARSQVALESEVGDLDQLVVIFFILAVENRLGSGINLVDYVTFLETPGEDVICPVGALINQIIDLLCCEVIPEVLGRSVVDLVRCADIGTFYLLAIILEFGNMGNGEAKGALHSLSDLLSEGFVQDVLHLVGLWIKFLKPVRHLRLEEVPLL